MINTIYTRVTVEAWNLSSTASVLVDIDDTQKSVTQSNNDTWNLEWTETEETTFFTRSDSDTVYTYSISIRISYNGGSTWPGTANRTVEDGDTLYVIIGDGFFTIADDKYDS
jgi:hypothetical protein